MWPSVPVIVGRVVCGAIKRWLATCYGACRDQRNVLVDIESVGKKSGSSRTSFIFVDFNAWEYAGSEVLWAALVTKIFNAVSFVV